MATYYDSHHPYEEIQAFSDVFIRLFSPLVDDDDLIWHWDTEDRDITVLQGGNWLYEEKGKEPIKLVVGYRHLIPKGVWHRIIKGDDDLIIRLTKIQNKSNDE